MRVDFTHHVAHHDDMHLTPAVERKPVSSDHTMKHNVIRLDDVARTVVHFFPEAVMELFVPIEDLLATTWWEWQPMSQDRSSPWQN